MILWPLNKQEEVNRIPDEVIIEVGTMTRPWIKWCLFPLMSIAFQQGVA